MANRADIVIGANFGDEGKGLITDYLAARSGEETLVVRHNGGAQAGHTVQTPDGKRHVFKHFSSGSFAGAKTYLSRFFVCNPLLYFQELESLKRLGVDPTVYVDPMAPVSTPYDMMINQIVEEHRAKGRHGSCGVGFGETIERNQYPEYALCFNDLKDRTTLRGQLEKIRGEWLPKRLNVLGVQDLTPEWQERIFSARILDWYMDHARDFVAEVTPRSVDILSEAKAVVFEGAQGLLLDQSYGSFPHVTRSNTGIRNAVALAVDAGIHDLKATYITRAYCTRHGAGPMANELDDKPYAGIVDTTNLENQYQGALRFGWLDLDVLSSSIYDDTFHARGMWKFSHNLAITCVDQTGPEISFVQNGQLMTEDTAVFINAAMQAAGTRGALISRGPTRKDISYKTRMDEPIKLLKAFQSGKGSYQAFA